jgi:chitodextrinase
MARVLSVFVAGLLVVAGVAARAVVHGSTDPTDGGAGLVAPRDLVAVAEGPQLVHLSWAPGDDASGIARYRIYRDGGVIATVDGTTLEFNDDTVQPETAYRYRVAALDGSGDRSQRSKPALVTTPAPGADGALEPPTELRAEARGPNEVVLQWSPAPGAGIAGYAVYRDGSEVGRVGESITTYRDHEVAPASAYAYTVRAFDDDGALSPDSNIAEVTTPPVADDEAPTTPAPVTLDQVAEGLEVRWTAASDNVQIAGYRFFRNDGLLGTVGGSMLTFVDTDDLCEGSYVYEVVAFDEAGNESEPGSAETSVVC